MRNDLVRRVYEHREGMSDGFTKHYGVKALVYFEQHATAIAAIQREKNIKHWSRKWKIDLICSMNPHWRLIIVGASLALLCAGTVSLFVRRLHDLGLSGYHAIWVAVAQIVSLVFAYGPPRVALIALPPTAVGFWLTLWPGNKNTNQFGAVPA